ncbi:MAG TPA: TonB-dependent receptor [Vicinamibacterales bacterium]|nr:TonB-dependent receptor [Vicinamibacterales bacterium]
MAPATALAQSAIAGTVKDTTGGAMPGVTVEVASPVLIEKVRSVVTDEQGEYKILDLRPGTYIVTFSLAGFSLVKREGIELTTLFTATVNAEMRVGTVEETVTVSGESPMVDVANVVAGRTIAAAVMDTLPTAKSFENLAASIPGMFIVGGNRPSAQDVGGTSGDRTFMAIHGGRTQDMTYQLDGLTYNTLQAQGSSSGFTPNAQEIQEYSYELGSLSAETGKGGIRVNMIPKEGGNQFRGSFFASGSTYGLEASNLTPDLKAKGLTAGNHMNKVWDVNPAIGGPLRKDTLWFFGSFRYWGLQDRVAGMFNNLTPTAFVYTPDLSHQAIDDSWNTDTGIRLTWQPTTKNKFSGYYTYDGRCQCHQSVSATVAPEASFSQQAHHLWLGELTWKSPLSSRLLLEAGILGIRHGFGYFPEEGVTPDILATTELSTGLVFRSNPAYNYTNNAINSFMSALSYVTGSHAVKVGFALRNGFRQYKQWNMGDVTLSLLHGVPSSLTEWTTPLYLLDNLNAEFGLFAQDQWTVKRLTVNVGGRFDYLNASVPAQNLPPAQFVGARNFAPVPDVPNWKSLSPRLGAAYDLFGTGKTALKVSISRYVAGEAVDLARANNPEQTSVNSATRTWNDVSGTFNPFMDCNLQNPAANRGCGALNNSSFGQTTITTHYDPAVTSGWGARGYNWETTAGVQQQLSPRVSLNASYFRRVYGNFTLTDNLAVTPENYSPYCITAPVDSRLPGGGGNQICGLYDINPAFFGKVNNLITFASHYGQQWEHYNGVDVNVNARLPKGAFLQGGMNLGRSETNNCFVVNSPQQLLYCDVKPPFQPRITTSLSYPLPWNLQVSGLFQSLPGPQITASQVVPNAQIAPSLGRNLAAGANGTATINLIAPGTMYADRLYQFDVRLTRMFTFGHTYLKANIDLYNAFNASSVLVLNNTFGPAWQTPSYLLPGRMIKFGGQIDF